MAGNRGVLGEAGNLNVESIVSIPVRYTRIGLFCGKAQRGRGNLDLSSVVQVRCLPDVRGSYE